MTESCSSLVVFVVCSSLRSTLRSSSRLAHIPPHYTPPTGGLLSPPRRRGIGSLSYVRSMCSSPSSSDSSLSFGARMEESVRKTVSENPVVVYSKTWCSYSMEVISLFKRLGVQPLVIELDELGAQGPQLQKVLERITGQFTVPNVFIGGNHIGGCTDTVRLHHKGELAMLLSEVNATSETRTLQEP